MIAGRRNRWGRRGLLAGVVCLFFGLTLVAALPGCGGCRKTEAEREKEKEEKEKKEKKEKEEKKPDFQVWDKRPVVFPTDGRRMQPCYKPGHWTATAITARANNFDFFGNLETAAVDGKGKLLPVSATPFDFSTTRQAALPKGQWKTFESVMFTPPHKSMTQFSHQLCYRKGGRAAVNLTPIAAKMPSYQYHFVVLARLPSRYLYLQGLNAIDAGTGQLSDSYYRVSLMRGDKLARLPSQSQWWTSTAYVLWDDADPEMLDLDQQRAMVDWLHWGGQLILSGPDTLDTLKGSFLEPYLPATAALGGREIDAEDFKPFREWSEKGKSNGTSLGKMTLSKPWTGIKFEIDEEDPNVQEVPHSGGLVVERRVGSGRVVATAFRLGSSALKNIPGGDEFLNAFLLGRPARRFVDCPDNPIIVNTLNDLKEDYCEIHWTTKGHRLDARHMTQVRYFSRDTGTKFATYGRDTNVRDGSSFGAPASLDAVPATAGVAAWNDFNPVAINARHTLKSAAEIEIPKPDFVIWVVAGYLLVLVPANWLIFRAMGRVEWAWVAAPIIAIACTVVVIRLAQLDIGFARSRTEIAVVEMQGGYNRAHLTRYTALYTALTTRYNVELDDPGGAVLPFPREDNPDQVYRGPRHLVVRRGEHVRLERFPVRSNKSDFIHSEQMLDLDGPLVLARDNGKLQVTNKTQFSIRDAGVLHRDESRDEMKVAWLGTLEPGDSKPLKWTRDESILEAQRRQSALTRKEPSSGSLSLGSLLQLAEEKENLRGGETRLVGTIDGGLPGMKIRPATAQWRCTSLLVAHLGFTHGKDPRPDINTPTRPKRN